MQGGTCGDTLFGWPELEYATRVTRGSVVTIGDSTAVTWNFEEHLFGLHPPFLKFLCVTPYLPSCCGIGGTAQDVVLH